MAVEVDLSKPLVPRIRLDGRWQKVEYENLPVVCFDCGIVGHTNVSCPTRDRGANRENKSGALATTMMLAGDASPEANAGFGPWMVVSQKSRLNQKDIATKGKMEQGMAIANGQKRGEERKEGEILGMAPPQKEGGSQPKQRQQTGERQAAKMEGKGKGVSKGKGKMVEAAVGFTEKGVLGPKPKVGEASSSGPSNVATQASSQTSQVQNPKQPAKFLSGPNGKEADLANPTGPATQAIGGNGTKIRIVEALPYQPTAPRVANPETPSAVSRTKSKKEGRGGGSKKAATPRKSTPLRHNALKPLQIWSPVKEKRGRNKEKRVSLTLQQIKEWTDAALPKAATDIELTNKKDLEKMEADPSGVASRQDAPGH